MRVLVSPRRALRAAGVAAVAAAALPAAASAAYVGAVSGTTVTMTGDGAADVLVVSQTAAAAPLLTHNRPPAEGFADPTDFASTVAGVQTVPANATITLVVDAGAGDDVVTASGVVLTATVAGGAGDDLLTGSARADALRGDVGNDRVVGAQGGDDMDGGDGNDVLVWNNGDGSDTIDGDGGNDETEVNGSANLGDVFTIVPNGPRVRFDRTNLVPFTLDVATERMAVNGLGGADATTGAPGLAALIALRFDGGAGADAFTGGDGADLVNGGEDADTLDGAGGDDRVVGDRGDDALRGGAGDDTLVWNNGDGSDTMDGQDGADTVEVNGAGAGDAFTVAAAGARARFDRTNLVPFTLDVGTAEGLRVNGLGGDDSLAVGAGAAALLAVAGDGGAGNDTFTGAEGAETFTGGSGNDTFEGGTGADVLDAGAGIDTVRARDGVADLVRCGADADTVLVDAAGDVAGADCERVSRRGRLASAASVSGRAAVRFRRGRPSVALRVTCPAASAGRCRGSVTLSARVRAGGTRVTAVLGRATFTVQSGQRRTVTVRLPRALRRLVGRGSVRTTALAVSRDVAGNVAERTRTVTLRVS